MDVTFDCRLRLLGQVFTEGKRSRRSDANLTNTRGERSDLRSPGFFLTDIPATWPMWSLNANVLRDGGLDHEVGFSLFSLLLLVLSKCQLANAKVRAF